jgi:subtilisin family serine protease
LPHVIKVASLVNDVDPSQHRVAIGVNLPPLGFGSPFAGERFLLATGGVPLPIDPPFALGLALPRASAAVRFFRGEGTSFAAPHVAGAHAVVKAGYRKLGIAYEVDWASSYLATSTGVDVIWVNPFQPDDGDVRLYRSIRFNAVGQ